jgi:ABC-type multidrug transport system fused ATPase/permease subunit
MKAKAFDTRLFKRILQYTKPYQWRFNGVIVFAVSLSVFAALRPYLLKQTVDGYIQTQDAEGLLYYITLMGIVLLRSILSVLLCFLGELVGTRHRERHSNQIVQTYTKFQNEIF